MAVVDNPVSAYAHLRSGDFRVGVIQLNREEQLGWVEQMCDDPRGAPIEWIALVSPPAIQMSWIREFVAARCFDFHTLPLDLERFGDVLGHADGMAGLTQGELLKPEVVQAPGDALLVGDSQAMKRVMRAIVKVAASNLPVLIGGESGTGKEQVALALHAASRRGASAPFVAVNCAALTPSLVQSELFGHEKGAFTGAHRQRIGRIEAAAGGTVLLDEVGDLPPQVQVSLLRFLEERTIERVGATETFHVDVRVIAATHVDLEAAVARGEFREDLFYRLNVLNIHVPPLRERPEDLVILADHFLARQRQGGNVRAHGFSEGARRAMLQHNWPGNVRELLNRVSQAGVMCEGRLITREDLSLERREGPRHLATLKEARDSAERQALMAALAWADGNVTRAAKMLEVSRKHLYNLFERHGLTPRRGD